MKWLFEFGIILFVTFLGEILYAVIPLPIPASIYGLILMLAALCLKIIKVEQVQTAGKFLIEIMPPMFIPAAVGLIEVWPQLRQVLLPMLVITVVTTVIVMVVTGKVSQAVIRRKKKEEKA